MKEKGDSVLLYLLIMHQKYSTLLYHNIPKMQQSIILIYLFTYLHACLLNIYLSSIILSFWEYQKVKLKCSLLLRKYHFSDGIKDIKKLTWKNSMVWAEPMYINIIEISQYNLIIHCLLALVFIPQVRIVTTIESISTDWK